MIERVLERTGATVRSRGDNYKAVAQSVLLYGSEIWVVTGYMIKVLEGFHHRAVRRSTGMTEKLDSRVEWGYPPVVEAMDTVGLHPIGVYIRRRESNRA